ncbi:MAG: hypothetical protein ABIN24_08280 [Dyadobacter sp.]
MYFSSAIYYLAYLSGNHPSVMGFDLASDQIWESIQEIIKGYL